MYQQPGQAAIPGMVAQPPPPQNVAQAAAPGAVPGAVPGAQPQPQAGVHGPQPPNRLSFFNKAPVDPAERFRGEGQKFRAKLIGIDQVPNSRGDKMCQEVILKQKSIVTASGLHKQRLIVQVTLEGITVIDADSNQTQFIHPVEKISFISRDTTDRRAFGYIVEGEEKQFHFFGIKTGNAAEGLVLALRDLFQVVYDIKQKEKAAGGATSQAASANLQNLEQGISELTVVANNASGAPAQPDTPTEAAPVGGNGLDDLAGAFDTAAPSPAAVSTENKMASIMGAFGSAPAAQPNPAMGGMGMPAQQNAFGGMGGMQGMGGMPQQTMAQPAMAQPAMSMPAMSQSAMAQPAMAQPAMSMPAMSQPAMSMPSMSQQPAMSMPAMSQPAMGQPAMSASAMSTQAFGGSSMGMMGAASMTPAASQQPAMTPLGGTNMGKAMNDPFADLGGLTGLKPKAAPVAAPTMGMMAASSNPPPPQQQSFDSLFG